MRKAYIVLAHKNPNQLVRLIQALDDNQSIFFIHLDKKADAAQFSALQNFGDKIVDVPGIDTKWGGFELVEATLRGIREVINYPKPFDFISLISGQHYPIKSNEYINNFLGNTDQKIFLEYSRIPDYSRWKIRGGLYRIDKYFFGLRGYERFTAKTLNYLSNQFPFIKRKFPADMKPYAGSQWWTMDNDSLHYMADFVSNNPSYTAYHKYTFAPDELFFHNILLNAKDDTILSGITNNNLLYMNWPDVDHGHPEILISSDIENIADSDALFARKFDMDHDALILDIIDEDRA